MNAEKQALVEAWWTKASHDLTAVRVLLGASPPALDIAVYHCQQAAEKAIKAWLVWKDIPFPKTHDLEALLKLCMPLDPGFETLMPHAHVLTPYVAEFRYPGDTLEPAADDAQEALRLAAEVLDYVNERIVFPS